MQALNRLQQLLKGEFLCTAERVTETHPMAKILGTVEDMEDFKQKIQKQKRLKRKTINSLKAYLPQEEIKLIEYKIEQPVVQAEFKECSIAVQGMFKNNAEKYEYLIKHNPDDAWITEFKKSCFACSSPNSIASNAASSSAPFNGGGRTSAPPM